MIEVGDVVLFPRGKRYELYKVVRVKGKFVWLRYNNEKEVIEYVRACVKIRGVRNGGVTGSK